MTSTTPAALQPHEHQIVDIPSPSQQQLATYRQVHFANQQDALDFDWQTIAPGTLITFDYNNGQPYHLRFCVIVNATRERQVIFRGLPGPNGERPIIDGENAYTVANATQFGFNAMINIGGQTGASWVTIEGLEIRHAQHRYTYYGDKTNDKIGRYSSGARAVFFELGDHFCLRNCELHHCGDGLFSYAPTYDMLVEHNYIHDNGVAVDDPVHGEHHECSMLDHNSYCATVRSTYQYNHYGPLLPGAWGYGLKDRGTGTIIRYNIISGGRRCISLDDAEDAPDLYPFEPDYNDAYVYGNLLIKNNDADYIRLWGDDEVIHFGGDGHDPQKLPYRRGTLFFYHNTVLSYRKDGLYPGGYFYGTTGAEVGRRERIVLFYTPEAEQTVDARNNIFATVTDGSYSPTPMTVLSAGSRKPGHGKLIFRGNTIFAPAGWSTTCDPILNPEDEHNGLLEGIGCKLDWDDPSDQKLGENTRTSICPVILPSPRDDRAGAPLNKQAALALPVALHPICNGHLAVNGQPLQDIAPATPTPGAFPG